MITHEDIFKGINELEKNPNNDSACNLVLGNVARPRLNHFIISYFTADHDLIPLLLRFAPMIYHLIKADLHRKLQHGDLQPFLKDKSDAEKYLEIEKILDKEIGEWVVVCSKAIKAVLDSIPDDSFQDGRIVVERAIASLKEVIEKNHIQVDASELLAAFFRNIVSSLFIEVFSGFLKFPKQWDKIFESLGYEHREIFGNPETLRRAFVKMIWQLPLPGRD